MSTIPTPHQFTAGEYPTAANLNSGAYTGLNWMLGGASGRRPTVQAYLSSAQSIPTLSSTILKYNTVLEDTDSGYSASTGQYTIATPGLWLFTASCGWSANSTGYRYVRILSGGSVTQFENTADASSGDTPGKISVAMLTRCSVGHLVYVAVLQNSGGSLNTGSGTDHAFSGVLLTL